MASKITLERTGRGLNAAGRAVFNSYAADGKITHFENNLIDGVENITIFFQDAATLDSYVAELNAIGEFRVPGTAVLDIQRFDDI